MCGIAGYLSISAEHPGKSAVQKMCERLVHRGPDAYGSFADDHVALGHRRLSIIDVTGGAQPLSNEDGTIHVVFNGEIYNFRELRRELISRGHTLKTGSDTEVLVHLYEDFGDRMPEHLNGMFAFALWDQRRRELLLGRDRMGEKPLYYAEHIGGTRFCFSSELKALRALPDFAPRISPTSVSDFLCLSYVPDPATIYEGVYKLPPAHTLTVGAAGARLRRYWRPAFVESEDHHADRAAERVHELSADAVARRMVSEVPIGAFLSGGVDSSSVVALMAKEAGAHVKTFSIGFEDPLLDELPYARTIAALHRTEHRERRVRTAIDDMFQPLVETFDEPFGDSSAVPMMHLARMTREHVTVALSGDGADELFGGYRRYRFGVMEQEIRDRLPQWFRGSVVRWGGRYYPKFDYLPQVFRAKTLMQNIARTTADAYFHSMSSFAEKTLSATLAPDLVRSMNGYSTRESFGARFSHFAHLSPLKQMQAVDMETYLCGDILVKTDRTTMAYSLEARCPWLDHRLVELACSMPSNLQLRKGSGKAVFKDAMRRYLPPELLQRRKMGFSVPLAEWLRTSLKPIFTSLVLRPEMAEFYSFSTVKQLWREHQSGLHNHDRKLWNLLMLASWAARHGQATQGVDAVSEVESIRKETLASI